MGTSGTTTTGAWARKWLGGIVGVVMVASIVWTAPAGQPAATAAPKGSASKPNIVLILTDDQRWDTLQWMPNVQSLLVNHGVTFDNAFVENSLCCPSRASTLTGQHSHQTGVWSNEPPYGGFPVFRDRSTIATWLRDAGYHTALIGKYLNGYKDAALAGYKPPGWERWVSFASNNGAHFNYDLTVDGTIRRDVEAFSTDVFANQAVNFIREKQGPLFLYFAPYAPHEPYIDLPERDNCLPLGPYDAPSFGESDVSDKPPYISSLPWTSKEAGTQGWIRRGQCNLIHGVDRAVGRIVSALEATKRLSNTMIVFMSDNGYMWGEHRAYHKAKPYEEAIRVPLVVRFDPVTREARTESRIALNLDLAPTFADVANVPAPGVAGRSLMPLLQGKPVTWRTDFLLEHSYGTEEELYRAPDYCGLRTNNWKYVLYMWGAEELYDLRSDPYEMSNLADEPSAQEQRKAMRAQVMQRCVPLPPRFPGS